MEKIITNSTFEMRGSIVFAYLYVNYALATNILGFGLFTVYFLCDVG
jgi:hypothetical protein